MLEDDKPRTKEGGAAAGGRREGLGPGAPPDKENLDEKDAKEPGVDKQSSDSFPASDPPAW